MVLEAAMRKKLFDAIFDNSAALYAGFAALVALTLAILIFVSQQERHYEDARNSVRERKLLYNVYIDLLGAETGQRGYLLTGDKAYLDPYNMAVGRLAADFKDLSGLTDATNGERSEINTLHELADQKVAELRSTIELQDAGRQRESLGLVNQGGGKAVMDRFRTMIDGLVLR